MIFFLTVFERDWGGGRRGRWIVVAGLWRWEEAERRPGRSDEGSMLLLLAAVETVGHVEFAFDFDARVTADADAAERI